MSIDAGGLAQMTYHYNTFGNGLGLPGSGFATRGKATNMQRLNVTSPAQGSIDDGQPTPRTSRSHLLAGLRTAPKSPAYPTSAPPMHTGQRVGLDASRYAPEYGQRNVPKTANSLNRPQMQANPYQMNPSTQFYSPEQVLAPPAIQIDDEADVPMDPNYYAELVRTNQYLAQQQMRLQQQLINVTAAAQQFQNMNLGQSYEQPIPMTPGLGFYNQQAQSGVQPVVEAVPQQSGLYTVFNPLTGQTNYFFDHQSQQQQQQQQQRMPQHPAYSNIELSHSPPPLTPTFRAQVSPPPQDLQQPKQQQQQPGNTTSHWRSMTPPKAAPSPQNNVAPLPPTSGHAFRANRKSLTLGSSTHPITEPVKSTPKSAPFPQTPLTGTFGPGQAREGDHPIRQPRGPPALEELLAKPTTKHEGSKNFASRQRRAAVKDVRAVMERRTASRGACSVDSVESLSPASEPDITFSISSDNDSDSVGSGSAGLSGKPSMGDLRVGATGVIGSERKERRERSRERGDCEHVDDKSIGMDRHAAASFEGKTLEEKVQDAGKRKTPLLVLTSAEKRRSGVF